MVYDRVIQDEELPSLPSKGAFVCVHPLDKRLYQCLRDRTAVPEHDRLALLIPAVDPACERSDHLVVEGLPSVGADPHCRQHSRRDFAVPVVAPLIGLVLLPHLLFRILSCFDVEHAFP